MWFDKEIYFTCKDRQRGYSGAEWTGIIKRMSSFSKKNLPFALFGGGTVVAMLIIVAALIFANPPQCPSYASSHDDCIVGANIGLGLYIFLGVGVWIVAILLALFLSVRNMLLDTKTGIGVRLAKGLILVCAASAATYLTLWYFFGHMSVFVHA